MSLPSLEEMVLTLKAHDPLFKATTDTATAFNFISLDHAGLCYPSPSVQAGGRYRVVARGQA